MVDSFHIAHEVNTLLRPTLTLESYKSKWNENISKAVFTEPKVEKEIDFQAEYAKRMEFLVIPEEKKAALKTLSEDFDFHVISSTNTSTIRAFLERNGVAPYFKDILGYDISTSKVEKFKMLIEKYSLVPEKMIFVTDTAGDIHEAKEVQIGTIIGVVDGYQDRINVEKAYPTVALDSLVEVPDWIVKNTQ